MSGGTEAAFLSAIKLHVTGNLALIRAGEEELIKNKVSCTQLLWSTRDCGSALPKHLPYYPTLILFAGGISTQITCLEGLAAGCKLSFWHHQHSLWSTRNFGSLSSATAGCVSELWM